MDNVFCYLVKMPDGVRECVLPCADGYTMYLNKDMDSASMFRAYEHALEHIANNDFSGGDVQEIERRVSQCP